MQQSNPNTLSHRRIAGNATFLVIRTVLSTLIGLFTSRVVLQVLGVEDYGLSAVAGSVVGMLNFLTGSLAGAGSRFITYEMGRGDADAMRRMFSATLFIQLGMAALILLLGETAGVWFLEYKLNIPPERMHAARWVYQLSIMSAALSVTQAPYSAIIMSYERMSIYAGFDILGMLLRLLIVYLLLILDGDKLITYATLGFAVSLAMLIINRAYCMKRFEECRGRPKFDKGATRSIFGYSMFTIISSFCVMICYSGTTFMINSFFGVVANAAVALAATIIGITMFFVANIQAAFLPHIVKQYAAGNSPTVWG
ncbi:MAG: lipopolysaccharide biosynthesis protein, partial [Muribaculaceae bacterium]|nr:lipopolysaccharide biosynthesis protein [Muribaculaceae bacterium]